MFLQSAHFTPKYHSPEVGEIWVSEKVASTSIAGGPPCAATLTRSSNALLLGACLDTSMYLKLMSGLGGGFVGTGRCRVF